jgi:hypothetical protein
VSNPRLGARIELFGSLLFSWKFVTTSFSKVVECFFTREQLHLSTPTQGVSPQCSTPPPPSGGKLFLQFILPPVLSRGCAICPAVMLDYVAPSKADDVSQSPGLQFYAALGWQRQVPCSRIMADPGHPRCLQDSF